MSDFDSTDAPILEPKKAAAYAISHPGLYIFLISLLFLGSMSFGTFLYTKQTQDNNKVLAKLEEINASVNVIQLKMAEIDAEKIKENSDAINDLKLAIQANSSDNQPLWVKVSQLENSMNSMNDNMTSMMKQIIRNQVLLEQQQK